MVTACSGDLNELQSHPRFSQIMAYFSAIAVPSMTPEELHTVFQVGAVEAMLQGGQNTLRKNIQELVRSTLYVADVVLSIDQPLSPLEKSLKQCIVPNLRWIGKFCSAFSLATQHLTSTSSLLQLWTHEWKRLTLDPLPNGALQSQLRRSFQKKLHEIDQELWGLDSTWLQALAEMSSEDVWLDTQLLQSAAYRSGSSAGSGSVGSPLYLPVQFLSDAPPQLPTDKGAGCSLEERSGSFDQELVMPNMIGIADVRAVLYPEAFSNVLRLVRLLASMSTNIFLPSHVGSHASQALKLASCICDMKYFAFDCKDKREISSLKPSAQTIYSNDFRSFLKQSLLTVSGFKEAASPSSKGGMNMTHASRPVQYSCVTENRVLMVVCSTQLMSDHDRRLLQYAVDLDNPCLIFDNREISGTVP